MATLKSKSAKPDHDAAVRRGYRRYITHAARNRVPVIKGQDRSRWTDVYHAVLRAPWWLFFAGVTLYFIGLNGFFAGFYLVDPRGIVRAHPGSWWDAFLFSVQTIGGINSEMLAHSVYANVVVSIEAFFGILNIAILTGVIFARFSRPFARVVFSKVAVIAPFDGVPTLMFRAANQRGNQIMDASIAVTIARQSMSSEGIVMRRFEELELVRSRSMLFSLSWTVMHRIDEKSPLHGATRESLEAGEATLSVLLSGRDDSLADTIYARHSYEPEDILWGRRFVDVIGLTGDGRRVVDLTRFHDTDPAEEGP
jgi:inward rectifier potassium channel